MRNHLMNRIYSRNHRLSIVHMQIGMLDMLQHIRVELNEGNSPLQSH